MAYMTADGKGPYPNKAGEFCGNYHTSYGNDDRFLRGTHRLGKPHACEAGTAEEMKAAGWMGTYLVKDLNWIVPGAIEIPTPPELMEPN